MAVAPESPIVSPGLVLDGPTAAHVRAGVGNEQRVLQRPMARANDSAGQRATDGAGHGARELAGECATLPTRATVPMLTAGAMAAVVVFFPAEGRVLAPLHAGVERLLGQAGFLLPLGLVFVGLVLAIRRVRPAVALPTRRLAGLALLALAVLPAERLLGYSTGALGEWLTGLLLEVLGGPLAVTLTLVVVVAGAVLALAVGVPRRVRAAR